MQMRDAGLEVGRELLERKAEIDHGDWLGWLAANFEGNERMAQRLMKAYRDCEANPTRASDLTTLRQIGIAFATPRAEEDTHRSTRTLLRQHGEPAAGEIDATAAEEDQDPVLVALENDFGRVVAMLAEARSLNGASAFQRRDEALHLAQQTTRTLKRYQEEAE